MILKRIALQGINYYHFPRKKNYKLLRITYSYFQPKILKFCTNSGSITEVFDTPEVQKYLNFITNENSHSEFDRVNQLLGDIKNLESEIQALENMSSEGNKELETLIKSEKSQYLDSIANIKNEILFQIMPNTEDMNDRNVELQILPGIGGEESKNFSKELYQMYINYSEYKEWECYQDNDNGYLKINGKFVFGHLKCEGGVHRVQRVPETEKSGRTHTSTCSVVILPQPRENEIQISNKDLLVEKMRSGGPGGQNVNKRETCVRVTHIPTGIVVERQTSRFQFENMKSAVDELRSILFNRELQKVMSERKNLRKEQAGTNDYSDKIRTYNYPQSRVTDHRIGYTTQNLRGFLSGNKELDYVISQIKTLNLKNELLSHIKNAMQSPDYKKFEKQCS